MVALYPDNGEATRRILGDDPARAEMEKYRPEYLRNVLFTKKVRS